MKRTKKQTGDRVSKLAGKWLRKLESCDGLDAIYLHLSKRDRRELKSVCASALGQDESKGARK